MDAPSRIAGHLALVNLEKSKKLHALITQNIDELHQIAGNSPELVIEVHGTMRRVMCWDCGMRAPMQKALDRVRAGEEDPKCRDCGGILKSDTISFGQQLVPEVIDRAMRVAGEGDLFLSVGTSLQVYPVAGAVDIARDAGREDRDRQRAADAVRRCRRRRARRLDQRGASGNPRKRFAFAEPIRATVFSSSPAFLSMPSGSCSPSANG